MKKEDGEIKGKSKKITIIIVLLVVLIVLGYCGTLYYNSLVKKEKDKIKSIARQNSDALLEVTEKIEYGTTMSYEELLEKLLDKERITENSKIKIFINDVDVSEVEAYNFDNVGKYTIRVDLEKEYTYKIIKTVTERIWSSRENEIEVVDTKIPIIIGASDKEIIVGDEINLLEGISAEDEIDGVLEVKIEGEVDTNRTGEYTVKAVAEDKNHNKMEREFKVIVKEKKIETTVKQTKTTNKTNNNNSNNGKKNNNDNNNSSSTTTNTNKTNTSNSNTNSNSNDSSTKSGRLSIAKAEAKKVVSQIIKSGMSEYQKAEAIFKYLVNNVSTQHNQSSEAYKTNYGNEAYAALVLKKAACSGFCKAVTLLCDAAGLKSEHVNANQWTHQWNRVFVGGEWIILDAQGHIFGGTEHPLS